MKKHTRHQQNGEFYGTNGKIFYTKNGGGSYQTRIPLDDFSVRSFWAAFYSSKHGGIHII